MSDELLSIEAAHRYQKLAMDYNVYRGSSQAAAKAYLYGKGEKP